MPRNAGKFIATILGAGFILVGLAGFIGPALMGMHLSTSHNLVHIISGVLALYFGLAGSARATRIFNLAFGVVYLLLGVVGFIAGNQGEPSAGVPGPGGSHIWKLIPDMLEFGTVDHLIHVLLGILFIIGGLLAKDTIKEAIRT